LLKAKETMTDTQLQEFANKIQNIDPKDLDDLTFKNIVNDSGVLETVGLSTKTGDIVKVVGKALAHGQQSSSEKIADKRRDTAFGRNEETAKAGRTAQAGLAATERALDIMTKGSLETGALANTKVALLKFGKALGIKLPKGGLETIAAAEEFRSLTIIEVLKLIQQTKGSISEAENKMFLAASAGLQTTVEGNMRILKFNIAQTKKAIKINEMINKLRRQKVGAEDIDTIVEKWKRAPENDITHTFLGDEKTVGGDEDVEP